jgi:hypothetical protein
MRNLKALSGSALLGWCVLAGCRQVGLEQAGKDVSVAGAVVEVFPDGDISFGGVSPHDRVGEQTVIFRSTGDEDAIVQKIFFDEEGEGVFTLSDNPAPVRLAAGEALTLKVEFDPETRKEYSGAMEVEIRGSGTAWVERRVVGSGCRDDNHDGVCEQGMPRPPGFDSGDTGWE